MEENKYIHVLDSNGNRITSIAIDILTTKEKALEQAKSIAPNCVYIDGGNDMLDEFLGGKIYVNGKFVEPPHYVPTKEDKINIIKAEYEPRFKTLEEAQRRLLLMGKPTTSISTQYIALNGEMVARIKEIK